MSRTLFKTVQHGPRSFELVSSDADNDPTDAETRTYLAAEEASLTARFVAIVSDVATTDRLPVGGRFRSAASDSFSRYAGCPPDKLHGILFAEVKRGVKIVLLMADFAESHFRERLARCYGLTLIPDEDFMRDAVWTPLDRAVDDGLIDYWKCARPLEAQFEMARRKKLERNYGGGELLK